LRNLNENSERTHDRLYLVLSRVAVILGET
jgi:hypothetical protein